LDKKNLPFFFNPFSSKQIFGTQICIALLVLAVATAKPAPHYWSLVGSGNYAAVRKTITSQAITVTAAIAAPKIESVIQPKIDKPANPGDLPTLSNLDAAFQIDDVVPVSLS